MNKKYIIYIIMVIVLILISIIFKTKEKDINSKVLENIKTISKETAIKVLKLEYGDFIDIDENDIKKVGDNYIIEVFVSIEDDEESDHNHSEGEDNTHKSSLGIHKINIYTGDVEFPK